MHLTPCPAPGGGGPCCFLHVLCLQLVQGLLVEGPGQRHLSQSRNMEAAGAWRCPQGSVASARVLRLGASAPPSVLGARSPLSQAVMDTE